MSTWPPKTEAKLQRPAEKIEGRGSKLLDQGSSGATEICLKKKLLTGQKITCSPSQSIQDQKEQDISRFKKGKSDMSSNISGSLFYQQLQEVLQKRNLESPLLASRHCGAAYHFGSLFIHSLHQLHKSGSLIVRGFLACLKNIIIENRRFPLPHFSPLAENSYLSPRLSPMSHPILMPPPVYSSNIISFLKFYTITPICKTRPPSKPPVLPYKSHDRQGWEHLPAFTLLHPQSTPVREHVKMNSVQCKQKADLWSRKYVSSYLIHGSLKGNPK